MTVVDDDMRPEYDFTGGERGKHYKVLREQGYIIRVYNDDGIVTERHVAGDVPLCIRRDGKGSIEKRDDEGRTHIKAGRVATCDSQVEREREL
jgi:hypothetical protein